MQKPAPGASQQGLHGTERPPIVQRDRAGAVHPLQCAESWASGLASRGRGSGTVDGRGVVEDGGRRCRPVHIRSQRGRHGGATRTYSKKSGGAGSGGVEAAAATSKRLFMCLGTPHDCVAGVVAARRTNNRHRI